MTMCDTDGEASPAKKPKTFCPLTFRQEIKGSEALKSLKKFLSAAKQSDNVVLMYLEDGGSVVEILSLIDVTAEKDLTTALPVFEVVHLILLRFQSPDSKYHQLCMNGAKIILNSHILTLKAMLSMNVTKQKKVALKLLTAIVTMHSSFASEVMNVIQLPPTMISDLTQPSSEKESVRKCFILFTLSFLVEGNVTILKQFLEKKSFVSDIIPGLKFDDAVTVNLCLSLFEDRILKNSRIHKTMKLKIFNTQILKSLFDLYEWKGPYDTKPIFGKKKNKAKEVEVNQQEKELVVDSVHSFLLLLCCSKKFGIAFFDKSVGTSEQLSNQLLLTVFESIGDLLKNIKVAELILKVITSCPDLVKPVLVKLEPSFQPRNTRNWFDAVEFAENLIAEMDVSKLLKSESETPSVTHVIKVAKSLCTPSVLLRMGKLGSQKSQPIEVRLHSLKLFSKMWDEIKKLLESFQKYQRDIKKTMLHFLSKYLPDLLELVELWHNLCDPDFFLSLSISVLERTKFLSVVLSCVQIIIQCQKDSVCSPLSLVSDMLGHIDQIKDSTDKDEFNKLQINIVQFVELDLNSLLSDMEIFEKCLAVLLQSPDNFSLASKILISTKIFKNSEVDVWLSCYNFLPLEHCESVISFLIDSLREVYKNRVSITSNRELNQENNQSYDVTEAYDSTVTNSLSSLLFVSLERLNFVFSDCSKKKKKVHALQLFLNGLIIALQHFYINDVYLYEKIKPYKKILSKAAVNYVKNWKKNLLLPDNVEEFLLPEEFELISWLLKSNDSRKFENIVQIEKCDVLKLFRVFRIILAYLTLKVANNQINAEDVEKYVTSLGFFINPEKLGDEIEQENIIVSDLKSLHGFYGNCLVNLLANAHLLNAFDIFKKFEGAQYITSIIVKVLMENKRVRDYCTQKNLTQLWKLEFLKQLKAKLKKNKSLDDVDYLETTLNFFEFGEDDTKVMVDLLTSQTELTIFVSDGKPSNWTNVFMKFIKMECSRAPLDDLVVQKFCSIVSYLTKINCKNLDLVDECFVYLLRKHPKHLLIIEDGFLDILLERTSINSTTIILGKLMLNDPKKVTRFFKIISKHLKEKEDNNIIYSLLPALLIQNDPLLEIIKSEKMCLVWKSSELEENTSSKLFKILNLLYQKFSRRIVKAIKGEKDDIILNNLDFTSELVKLFLAKDDIKVINKSISKGNFQPELFFEVVKKLNVKTITESYLQGLIMIFCRIIKNFEDFEELVLWPKYCSIISDLLELNKEYFYQKMEEFAEWEEFVKLSIGHCFTSAKHPSLLKILSLLVNSFSFNLKSEEKFFSTIFQMIISHSQFLNVILSSSPLKSELVELFYNLVKRVPSEVSSKHVPVLLASYSASLSSCDETILKILRFYETSGINLSNFQPFVWGQAAISRYSIGDNPALSLWQQFSMTNVLDLLDIRKIEISLQDFPIQRSMENKQSFITASDSTVYDPAFLLPLFANLLSPGSVVFCLPFIYKGALGYTVRALSSECNDIRTIASVVLTRFHNHLESSQNLKQKSVWIHFINCFRYGIKNLLEKPLPNITTLFFAKMTLELTKLPAEMYIPLQNFLLAKPYFFFDSVPEFLPLFHSSEVSHLKHREWLLQILRDGTKNVLDLNVIFHSMGLKIIFCFFQSPFCDNDVRCLILQVIEKIVKVEKSFLLISEYGLLNWISSISELEDSSSFLIYLNDLIKLLLASSDVIIQDLKSHKSKQINLTYIIQILSIMIKLLPVLKLAKSVEIFTLYIRVLFNCVIVFINEERVNWFKLNKNRLQEIVAIGVDILGKDCDCEKFTEVSFYFREYDEDKNNKTVQDLKNFVFIFNQLVNREVNYENITE